MAKEAGRARRKERKNVSSGMVQIGRASCRERVYLAV